MLLVDGQTTQLELATRRALDELTLRVTPRNLERMRALKGRITALSGKVDTVRLGGEGGERRDKGGTCLAGKSRDLAWRWPLYTRSLQAHFGSAARVPLYVT